MKGPSRVSLVKGVSFALVAVSCLSMVACESSEPKRRKAVPPPTDLSGLPWNRPTKNEGAAGVGSMMPQSR
jgi:hypothetical protein